MLQAGLLLASGTCRAIYSNILMALYCPDDHLSATTPVHVRLLNYFAFAGGGARGSEELRFYCFYAGRAAVRAVRRDTRYQEQLDQRAQDRLQPVQHPGA